jgi:hypothetical protein
VALVLASLVGLPLAARHGAGELGLIVTAIVGLLVAAFAGGPRLVLGYARVLGRRRGVEALLAQRRLRADPRTAGRVAGVLFVCGLALAVEALLIVEQIFDSNFGDDTAFWVTGYGMTAVVVLVAAAVALLTLLVGAADGLLDARRPLATLGALGVDERMLERVVALQLSATAVPAVVAGALISAAVVTVLGAFAGDAPAAVAVRVILPAAATALVAALLMAAAARLAARLLRSLIRAAIDPENLRVA